MLLTPCERALWLSGYSVHPADGLDAWRCSIFRNEGAGLSSDLIRSAMAATAALWGELPADGWVTWIDTAKVAPRPLVRRGPAPADDHPPALLELAVALGRA